jgi:hypothetical protein
VVIVQVIRTRWTKASRGAPGSIDRAAVAEGTAFCPVPSGTECAVQELEADEVTGFALDERRWDFDEQLPTEVSGLRLTSDNGVVEVERVVSPDSGWPPRDTPRVAFRLRQGEWGRAVRNFRHSGREHWSYTKVVVNVASLGAPSDPSLFVGGAPNYVFDEQALLR